LPGREGEGESTNVTDHGLWIRQCHKSWPLDPPMSQIVASGSTNVTNRGLWIHQCHKLWPLEPLCHKSWTLDSQYHRSWPLDPPCHKSWSLDPPCHRSWPSMLLLSTGQPASTKGICSAQLLTHRPCCQHTPKSNTFTPCRGTSGLRAAFLQLSQGITQFLDTNRTLPAQVPSSTCPGKQEGSAISLCYARASPPWKGRPPANTGTKERL
uniref:Uncharacterized protein n=1 Tax=Junco hyemalis TaxID=40217 RepID=A0A8C5JL14_JUNHY